MADDIKWYGKKVFSLATDANIRAMNLAVKVVERDIVKNFTKQGSGRAYKRTKSGKVHRASTPGQPPAIDMGILRASIASKVKKKTLTVDGMVGPDIEKIAAKAEAGTDVNYGFYLEYGTKGGSRIAARPFLRPAIRRTRRRVMKIFKRANGG